MQRSLTAAERTTLEGRLKDAEDALHKRRTGQQVSRIRHADKDMTFVGSNPSDLIAYIDSLKAQLGLPTSRQRAQRIVFG
jgi:hypothetical protein